MPFEIISQTDYLLISLKGDMKGDENPSLEQAFQEAQAKQAFKYVVFQANECGSVSLIFIRSMAMVYKTVKGLNGQVRLVGANKSILEPLAAQGLDQIFINKISVRGALLDFGLVKAKEFDTNFLNPFLNATQKVLKIQCFTESKNQKPYLKKPEDPMLMGDISGIIAITADSFCGTLAISFPESIFVQIASKMLGEEIKQIHDGVVDLVGELSNMILGQAKIELGTLGYVVQMALPSCVWGKDHKIKHFGGGRCIVIPFETQYGIFHCEIMTDQKILEAAKKPSHPKAA